MQVDNYYDGYDPNGDIPLQVGDIMHDLVTTLAGGISSIGQREGISGSTIIGTNGQPVKILEDGYIIVTIHDRSERPVWFDRFQVLFHRGKLKEEDHYYPYGLPMAGMGSTAAGMMPNRRKYQSNEFITEAGLNWMSFGARQYDPQIGRFLSVDPLADVGQDMFSPYAAMGDEPAGNVDPNGTAFSPVGGPYTIMTTGPGYRYQPGANDLASIAHLMAAGMSSNSDLADWDLMFQDFAYGGGGGLGQDYTSLVGLYKSIIYSLGYGCTFGEYGDVSDWTMFKSEDEIKIGSKYDQKGNFNSCVFLSITFLLDNFDSKNTISMEDVASGYEKDKNLAKGVGLALGVNTEADVVNLTKKYFRVEQSERSEGRTSDQAFSMFKNSIDSGNPILAWIPGDITSAHVITIVGYNPDTKQLRAFNTNYPNSYQIFNPLDFYQGFIYINGIK